MSDLDEMIDNYVTEIAKMGMLREGYENPTPIVARWSMVMEIETGDESFAMDVTSERLAAWHMRGHAWLLEKAAEDQHDRD